MLEMAISSAKLFFAGKLFKDNATVVRLFLTGCGAGAAAGIVLGFFVPVWLAAIIAGTVAGFMQPVLLKNVKYA
jgi:hypothetical protein